MNTKSNKLIALAVAFMAIIAVSCSKEDNTGNANNYDNSGISDNPVIGTITDKGVVNGDIRLMVLSLANVGTVVDPLSPDYSNPVSLLYLNFFTAVDGTIASGIYSFSGDSEKAGFTFDFGSLTEKVSGDSKSVAEHTITNGTVEVRLVGTDFEITFDCLLDSGMKLVGTFVGKMNYYDDHD